MWSLLQNVSSKETISQSRKSLFAQQFAASGAVTFGVPKHQKDNLQKTIEEVKVTQAGSCPVKYQKSSLISGEGLAQGSERKTLKDKAVDEIHKENVAKLEAMTHEEIMEEQARIKSALGEFTFCFCLRCVAQYLYNSNSITVILRS